MIATIGRAINLLQSGFSIIPIGDKKVPWIKWKQYQEKQIDKSELEMLGNNPKTKGFGIITGFNNLECIDIDLKVLPSLKEQKEFWEEFLNLLQDHIDDFDKKFVIYKTVNSGYHIIYRCQSIEGNKTLAKLKGHDRAILETRGNGGYIFVYDNQISKLSYEDVKEITEDDRAILFGLCKYYDYKEDIEKIEVRDTNNGLNPWDDFNSRNTVYDVFQNDFKIVRNLKDKTIIKRDGAESPHSGYVFHDSGMMYLFSTATIYPAEKLLSPFSIYAYKYHNGDHTKASADLYKKGYGERVKKNVILENSGIEKQEIDFPIEIFPENLQSYLIESHNTLNLVIDYMACSLIWSISLIVGNSVKIEVKKGWKESVNIWVALVGSAGVGKTPSINHISFPLENKNGFELKTYAKNYAKFREYIDTPKDEKKYLEKVEEPKKNQFIVNDVTIEALTELHEQVPNSLGILKDELNGWIKDMNKYRTGSDLEFWLSSWSNKPAIITRKTSNSNYIQSPVIPVLGGIQPGIFSEVASDQNKENGFIDRLLLCYPDITIPEYNVNNLSDDFLDWFDGYMSGFYDKVRKQIVRYDEEMSIKPWVCTWTKEAEKEWIRIFNDIVKMQNSDHENEYVKSMLSKQKSYIPRFALIMHCLYCYEYPDRNILWVEKDAILAAEKLSKYFIQMSKKIKIDTLETMDLKKALKLVDDLPISEKIKQIFAGNPDANKSQVAQLLNISRQSLYNHLKK